MRSAGLLIPSAFPQISLSQAIWNKMCENRRLPLRKLRKRKKKVSLRLWAYWCHKYIFVKVDFFDNNVLYVFKVQNNFVLLVKRKRRVNFIMFWFSLLISNVFPVVLSIWKWKHTGQTTGTVWYSLFTWKSKKKIKIQAPPPRTRMKA